MDHFYPTLAFHLATLTNTRARSSTAGIAVEHFYPTLAFYLATLTNTRPGAALQVLQWSTSTPHWPSTWPP